MLNGVSSSGKSTLAAALQAALVGEGLRVIYDAVLQGGDWHDDLRARLKPDEVLWVGVHCSPEALDERERARGDRMIGQARLQLAQVHKRHDLRRRSGHVGDGDGRVCPGG